MRRTDVLELILLASLWGASFLFMRIASPEFGPIALITLRVAVAALVLLPIYLLRGGAMTLLWQHWRALLLLGVLNSSIPFSLFAYATLTLPAGTTSVLNSSAPFFAALLAVALGNEHLSGWRWLGLGVGAIGVLILMGGPTALQHMPAQNGLAVAATLVATMFYAIAGNYTRRYLSQVPALAVATGSQIGATLVLAPLALILWPSATPALPAWGAVLGLGVLCTGLAYVLFFRLLSHVGPVKAMSVTFLIPLFGMLWGLLFLGETLTVDMVAGCLVILLGTALSTGLWPRRGG